MALNLYRFLPEHMSFVTPDYLYKYCSSERALQILEDRYLYLARVDQLNDVYEASAEVLLRPTPATAETVFLRKLMTIGALSHEEAMDVASRIPAEEKQKDVQRLLAHVKRTNLRLRTNSGVACFSAKFNDQRMWGTYGSSHSGACIQFSSNEASSIVRRALPVLYSRESLLDVIMESIEPDGSLPTQTLLLLFLTKSTDWAEEQEWRIVSLGDGAISDAGDWQKLPFAGTDVRRVFLGGRMDVKAKQRVHDLADAHAWSVFELDFDSASGESHWHGMEQIRGPEDLEFWRSNMGSA